MSSQFNGIVSELRNQVIQLWSVIYNSDSDCVYMMFSWPEVLRNVESSLRTYLDDDQASDAVVTTLMDAFREWDDRPLIPIHITRNDHYFHIDIYRWEIDSFTPLYRLLNKCYTQVDDDTKLEIMALLSNSKL